MLRLQSRCLAFGCRALPTLLLVLFVRATPLLAKSGTNQQPTVLLPNQPSYFHLPAGASLDLALDAQPGHDAELLIETSARDASFVVLGLVGQQLQAVDAEQPGWLAFQFPCAQPGQYRLIARRKTAENASSGISLRVDYLPFPDAGAGRRAQAAILFAAAQSLASAACGSAPRGNRKIQTSGSYLGGRSRSRGTAALSGWRGAGLAQFESVRQRTRRDQSARLLSLPTPFFRAWLSNLESEVYLDRWDSDRAMRFAQEGMRFSRALADPWLSADAFAARGKPSF